MLNTKMSSKGGQNVDNVEVENSDVSNTVDDLKILHDGELQDIVLDFKDDQPPQQTPSTQSIHRVPTSTSADLKKYCSPKVVSIGPYHFGNKELKAVEELKLEFAKDLFSNQGKKKLEELYDTLREPSRLQKLRNYYDEKSIKKFSEHDLAFANIMFLDGCFILYYILLSRGVNFQTKGKLLNHQMISIRQDLFLLENQIPFEVLQSVVTHYMNSEDYCETKIKEFIVDSSFSPRMAATTKPAAAGSRTSSKSPGGANNNNSVTDFLTLDIKNQEVRHLLHLLRLSLTITCNNAAANSSAGAAPETTNMQQHALPRVTELMDAGIRFKKSNTTLLCHIDFSKHWYGRLLRATVRLPPILVEEASTKYLFLNLMAYEASFHKPNDMWVTSYICLLNSLISRSEDVKALRDAGVFADSQGSESDIQKVIKEIAAAGRVPDDSAYLEAKTHIQQFYDRFKCCNLPFSQLKENYFKSPWSALALAGAILALFLSAVQTYFTVWSPKDECDDLCKLLKLNHHL